MGPTICAKRFRIDQGGSVPLKFMEGLLNQLAPLEKKIPKLTLQSLDAPAAAAYMSKTKEWLSAFVSQLGYQQDDSYLPLHILRKFIIVQTILAQRKRGPDTPAEAVQSLQEFSSVFWLSKTDTMSKLRGLVPDEAEYLSYFSGVLRPWQLLDPYVFVVFFVCACKRDSLLAHGAH